MGSTLTAPNRAPLKVFVIAGEASGDKLGAALMDGFHALRGDDVSFMGVGGPRMTEAGLESLFPMDEISIMGISEILSQYRFLKRRIRETAAAVIAAKPDVLITIDLPEFSLRVAHLVKASSDIRTVHYVAPTVWAWRPGRAKKMARDIDHVLALFPFEPPYMHDAGMACDFVGHPVVTDPQATVDEARAFRISRAVDAAPMVLLLPGSRRSEIARLMPIFAEVIAKLHAKNPAMRFVLPAAEAVSSTVRDMAADWPVQPIIVDTADKSAKRAAFAAADVALAASGTVSLELAAAQTPMVIAYDMSWLSRQIIGRLLRTDTVTLVNLVAQSRTIPEYIGENCKPGPIADAVLEVLAKPKAQTEAMSLTMQRLGQGGDAPGTRAAQAVLKGLS